jgi:hypothetical protein
VAWFIHQDLIDDAQPGARFRPLSRLLAAHGPGGKRKLQHFSNRLPRQTCRMLMPSPARLVIRGAHTSILDTFRYPTNKTALVSIPRLKEGYSSRRSTLR